jgi:hypothetical protein
VKKGWRDRENKRKKKILRERGTMKENLFSGENEKLVGC